MTGRRNTVIFEHFMKNTIALLGLSIAVVGCSSFKNGSPPSKVEQQLFTVTTNYIPVVVVGTNGLGSPVTLTNLQPTYTYTPGPTIGAAKDAAGLIPGYGTLVGTGIGVLAAFWGWLRSSKNGATAATLAQEIEAIREFMKALPNGAAYDNALVQYLQSHQAEEGTIQNVLSVLAKEVSSSDAKMAAQQIIATLTALNPSSVPPGTAVKV